MSWFKIRDKNQALLNKEETIGLTRLSNVDYGAMQELTWDEFVDLEAIDALKTKKKRFSAYWLAEAKKLASVFVDLSTVNVLYYLGQPIIMLLGASDFVVLVAPLIEGGVPLGE